MPKRKDILLEGEAQHPSNVPNGDNHLLVIAIDKYKHCPKLNNCVKDAEEFASLLWEKYQFEEARTYFLRDDEATRKEILNTIKDLRHKVGEQDSLVIYYSGHGQTVDNVGYWVPVEAEENEASMFISTFDLKTRLDHIKSFHTFLIADACFSGALLITRKDISNTPGENRRSRWGLAASHSREKALDGNPGENSPFAKSLLKKLRNNTDKLGIHKLAHSVIDEVHANTSQKQTPVFKALDLEGDEDGEGQFYFKLKNIQNIDNDYIKKNILSAKSIETIREHNKVQIVRGLEEGLKIDELPNGRYGYTVPWLTNIDGNTTLKLKGGTSQLEIHKDFEGKINIIGFADYKDILKLQSQKNERQKFILFLNNYQKYVNQSVSIPTDIVLSMRNRSISGGIELIDLELNLDKSLVIDL